MRIKEKIISIRNTGNKGAKAEQSINTFLHEFFPRLVHTNTTDEIILEYRKDYDFPYTSKGYLSLLGYL